MIIILKHSDDGRDNHEDGEVDSKLDATLGLASRRAQRARTTMLESSSGKVLVVLPVKIRYDSTVVDTVTF